MTTVAAITPEINMVTAQQITPEYDASKQRYHVSGRTIEKLRERYWYADVTLAEMLELLDHPPLYSTPGNRIVGWRFDGCVLDDHKDVAHTVRRTKPRRSGGTFRSDKELRYASAGMA